MTEAREGYTSFSLSFFPSRRVSSFVVRSSSPPPRMNFQRIYNFKGMIDAARFRRTNFNLASCIWNVRAVLHRGWFIHRSRGRPGHLIVGHSVRGARAHGVGSKVGHGLASRVGFLLRGTGLNDLSLSPPRIPLSLRTR